MIIWSQQNKANEKRVHILHWNPGFVTMPTLSSPMATQVFLIMTSSKRNIIRVTGPLWWIFTSHRWIPFTKARDAELWCFLWSAPEQTDEQTIAMPVIWDAIALIMASRQCNDNQWWQWWQTTQLTPWQLSVFNVLDVFYHYGLHKPDGWKKLSEQWLVAHCESSQHFAPIARGGLQTPFVTKSPSLSHCKAPQQLASRWHFWPCSTHSTHLPFCKGGERVI